MSSTGSLSLLCLALFVVGDARNMSLVLVKEAVNEVVSSASTSLHAQSSYRRFPCRELSAWTAQRQVTTSGKAVVAVPANGSYTREVAAGVTLLLIV